MLYKFSNTHFQIEGKIDQSQSNFKMLVKSDLISTSTRPQTIDILQKHLPTIFSNHCFNYDNLSFRDECKNTEVAHLYEHMILEYLCLELVKSGQDEATYKGTTAWNWEKEPKGSFNIQINAGKNELSALQTAITNSTNLFTQILESN